MILRSIMAAGGLPGWVFVENFGTRVCLRRRRRDATTGTNEYVDKRYVRRLRTVPLRKTVPVTGTNRRVRQAGERKDVHACRARNRIAANCRAVH